MRRGSNVFFSAPAALLLAFILLFLTCVSVPFVQGLRLFTLVDRHTGGSIRFGLWGYCLPKSIDGYPPCSMPEIGWTFNHIPTLTGLEGAISAQLTGSLFIHAIVTVATFLIFTLASAIVFKLSIQRKLAANFRRRSSLDFLPIVFNLIAAILASVAFIIDVVVIVKVEYRVSRASGTVRNMKTYTGAISWLTFVASVILWTSTVMLLFLRSHERSTARRSVDDRGSVYDSDGYSRRGDSDVRSVRSSYAAKPSDYSARSRTGSAYNDYADDDRRSATNYDKGSERSVARSASQVPTDADDEYEEDRLQRRNPGFLAALCPCFGRDKEKDDDETEDDIELATMDGSRSTRATDQYRPSSDDLRRRKSRNSTAVGYDSRSGISDGEYASGADDASRYSGSGGVRDAADDNLSQYSRSRALSSTYAGSDNREGDYSQDRSIVSDGGAAGFVSEKRTRSQDDYDEEDTYVSSQGSPRADDAYQKSSSIVNDEFVADSAGGDREDSGSVYSQGSGPYAPENEDREEDYVTDSVRRTPADMSREVSDGVYESQPGVSSERDLRSDDEYGTEADRGLETDYENEPRDTREISDDVYESGAGAASEGGLRSGDAYVTEADRGVETEYDDEPLGTRSRSYTDGGPVTEERNAYEPREAYTRDDGDADSVYTQEIPSDGADYVTDSARRTDDINRGLSDGVYESQPDVASERDIPSGDAYVTEADRGFETEYDSAPRGTRSQSYVDGGAVAEDEPITSEGGETYTADVDDAGSVYTQGTPSHVSSDEEELVEDGVEDRDISNVPSTAAGLDDNRSRELTAEASSDFGSGEDEPYQSAIDSRSENEEERAVSSQVLEPDSPGATGSVEEEEVMTSQASPSPPVSGSDMRSRDVLESRITDSRISPEEDFGEEEQDRTLSQSQEPESGDMEREASFAPPTPSNESEIQSDYAESRSLEPSGADEQMSRGSYHSPSALSERDDELLSPKESQPQVSILREATQSDYTPGSRSETVMLESDEDGTPRSLGDAEENEYQEGSAMPASVLSYEAREGEPVESVYSQRSEPYATDNLGEEGQSGILSQDPESGEMEREASFTPPTPSEGGEGSEGPPPPYESEIQSDYAESRSLDPSGVDEPMSGGSYHSPFALSEHEDEVDGELLSPAESQPQSSALREVTQGANKDELGGNISESEAGSNLDENRSDYTPNPVMSELDEDEAARSLGDAEVQEGSVMPTSVLSSEANEDEPEPAESQGAGSSTPENGSVVADYVSDNALQPSGDASRAISEGEYNSQPGESSEGDQQNVDQNSTGGDRALESEYDSQLPSSLSYLDESLVAEEGQPASDIEEPCVECDDEAGSILTQATPSYVPSDTGEVDVEDRSADNAPLTETEFDDDGSRELGSQISSQSPLEEEGQGQSMLDSQVEGEQEREISSQVSERDPPEGSDFEDEDDMIGNISRSPPVSGTEEGSGNALDTQMSDPRLSAEAGVREGGQSAILTPSAESGAEMSREVSVAPLSPSREEEHSAGADQGQLYGSGIQSEGPVSRSLSPSVVDEQMTEQSHHTLTPPTEDEDNIDGDVVSPAESEGYSASSLEASEVENEDDVSRSSPDATGASEYDEDRSGYTPGSRPQTVMVTSDGEGASRLSPGAEEERISGDATVTASREGEPEPVDSRGSGSYGSNNGSGAGDYVTDTVPRSSVGEVSGLYESHTRLPSDDDLGNNEHSLETEQDSGPAGSRSYSASSLEAGRHIDSDSRQHYVGSDDDNGSLLTQATPSGISSNTDMPKDDGVEDRNMPLTATDLENERSPELTAHTSSDFASEEDESDRSAVDSRSENEEERRVSSQVPEPDSPGAVDSSSEEEVMTNQVSPSPPVSVSDMGSGDVLESRITDSRISPEEDFGEEEQDRTLSQSQEPESGEMEREASFTPPTPSEGGEGSEGPPPPYESEIQSDYAESRSLDPSGVDEPMSGGSYHSPSALSEHDDELLFPEESQPQSLTPREVTPGAYEDEFGRNMPESEAGSILDENRFNYTPGSRSETGMVEPDEYGASRSFGDAGDDDYHEGSAIPASALSSEAREGVPVESIYSQRFEPYLGDEGQSGGTERDASFPSLTPSEGGEGSEGPPPPYESGIRSEYAESRPFQPSGVDGPISGTSYHSPLLPTEDETNVDDDLLSPMVSRRQSSIPREVTPGAYEDEFSGNMPESEAGSILDDNRFSYTPGSRSETGMVEPDEYGASRSFGDAGDDDYHEGSAIPASALSSEPRKGEPFYRSEPYTTDNLGDEGQSGVLSQEPDFGGAEREASFAPPTYSEEVDSSEGLPPPNESDIQSECSDPGSARDITDDRIPQFTGSRTPSATHTGSENPDEAYSRSPSFENEGDTADLVSGKGSRSQDSFKDNGSDASHASSHGLPIEDAYDKTSSVLDSHGLRNGSDEGVTGGVTESLEEENILRTCEYCGAYIYA